MNLLWDPATSPSRLLVSGSDTIVYGLGPLYSVNGTTVTTYARDGQKSIRAELNGTSVTSSFRYRAYGEVAQAFGAAAPSILGYAGQLLDPSGLLYMRARWYDAASTRFLSRDPLTGSPATPATLNSFNYGGANPVLRLDPSGAAFRDSDATEGGGCDSECVFRLRFGRPAEVQPPDVNPCANTTDRCSYYLTGTPTGTVEVRVNDDTPLGWLVGVLGFGPNNVAFGTNLVVSNYNLDPRDPIVSHEIGHTVQAEILESQGYNYLGSYLLLLTGNHATHPMEIDANRRARLGLMFPDSGKPKDYRSPFNYRVQSHP